MQIGNDVLDKVCDEVFFPAIEGAGLTPRRVDRHNAGDLLKSEIVGFIERADVIVADLTNERPNCYLEIGYAMGLGKKRNLIMTVRQDHHHSHPEYKASGPKVHFDLEGYDLLLWDEAKLDEFRAELEKRIKRRLAIVRPPSPAATTSGGLLLPPFNAEWLSYARSTAEAGLGAVGLKGTFEAVATIEPKGWWDQKELLQAIDGAQIKTFGWPIGLVLDRDPDRPHPTAGGIVAEVKVVDHPFLDRPSYDYWSLTRDGDFYTLRSLFEDSRDAGDKLFFNTRIVQVTELLLFLSRLYLRLDLPTSTIVRVEVRHAGLKNRTLAAVGGRQLFQSYKCVEDALSTEVVSTVGGLESDLVANVKDLLAPLFILFEFTEFGDEVWADIVNKFVDGQVT